MQHCLLQSRCVTRGKDIPKTPLGSWEFHVPLCHEREGLAAFPPFQSERASKEALGFASWPL